MRLLARLVLPLLLALGVSTLPAGAVQPVGTAAYANVTIQLFDGPGTEYAPAGIVDGGEKIRVARCTQLWCEINARHEHGWVLIRHLSFGRGPEPFPYFPHSPLQLGGGPICFYSGANYKGEEYCFKKGTVKDLALVDADNKFASARVFSGTALVCRDRWFHSYCEYINEDKPHLTGYLSRNVSSIRVY
jgi:uncharacterized protein YraI